MANIMGGVTTTPLAIKTIRKNITDQTYIPESENAQSGVAVAEALSGYVQKVKGNGFTNQVYAVSTVDDMYCDITMTVEDNAGFETGFDYGKIPSRQVNGNLMTNTPVKDLDCANKAYVDSLVGDIETALDEIIALQEKYIGGDSV